MCVPCCLLLCSLHDLRRSTLKRWIRELLRQHMCTDPLSPVITLLNRLTHAVDRNEALFDELAHRARQIFGTGNFDALVRCVLWRHDSAVATLQLLATMRVFTLSPSGLEHLTGVTGAGRDGASCVVLEPAHFLPFEAVTETSWCACFHSRCRAM